MAGQVASPFRISNEPKHDESSTGRHQTKFEIVLVCRSNIVEHIFAYGLDQAGKHGLLQKCLFLTHICHICAR